VNPEERVKAWTPLWRTPTRSEAAEILRTSRDITDALLDGVPSKRMAEIGPLGGGVWSINDLIGHLATWEERALIIMGARQPLADAAAQPSTTDEFNAFHIERKRRWSAARIRKDAAAVRSDLLAAIAGATDDDWLTKVDTGNGRSALGLYLGKVLTGEKYGYYAHDLAHYRDLRKATGAS
jgi:uncharacterized protein (TIGR03083 family)